MTTEPLFIIVWFLFFTFRFTGRGDPAPTYEGFMVGFILTLTYVLILLVATDMAHSTVSIHGFVLLSVFGVLRLGFSLLTRFLRKNFHDEDIRKMAQENARAQGKIYFDIDTKDKGSESRRKESPYVSLILLLISLVGLGSSLHWASTDVFPVFLIGTCSTLITLFIIREVFQARDALKSISVHFPDDDDDCEEDESDQDTET